MTLSVPTYTTRAEFISLGISGKTLHSLRSMDKFKLREPTLRLRRLLQETKQGSSHE